MIRTYLALAALTLVGCGAGLEPAEWDTTTPALTAPDAGVDVGCVVEYEDGAQFADSTVAWAPPPCYP